MVTEFPIFLKVVTPTNRKRIIIIGAGIAGITAAQQLTFFGFDVIILEARDYVGCDRCLSRIVMNTLPSFRGEPIITLIELAGRWQDRHL